MIRCDELGIDSDISKRLIWNASHLSINTKKKFSNNWL